jgi:hypothetical protein
MPSADDLDQLMKQWGQEWAGSRFPDYFDALWRSAKVYYQTGCPSLRPNFEKVLGDMVALAHWMEPAPWGDTLRQIVSNGEPPRWEPVAHQEGKYEQYIKVMDQFSRLLEGLARHMRAQSQRLDSADTPKKGKYGKLLGGLREKFDVGVYNLNYDTAALGALPGAYTGFDKNGVFEPRAVHERDRWDFVYHLHGSVHHSLDRRFGDKIVWRRSTLEGEFYDGPEGRRSDSRSDGIKLPRTTLVAGGFKLDQLLVEPFRSFHASLVGHVYAANAILIGGYGFGDAHVNWSLRNRLSTPNTRPPVMVLHRACDKTDPMKYRGDMWAKELGLALGTGMNGHFFAEPGNPSDPIPAELAKKDAFEVDAQHRVALWHGGFIEGERRLPNIVQWLDGAADGVLVPDFTE